MLTLYLHLRLTYQNKRLEQNQNYNMLEKTDYILTQLALYGHFFFDYDNATYKQNWTIYSSNKTSLWYFLVHVVNKQNVWLLNLRCG